MANRRGRQLQGHQDWAYVEVWLDVDSWPANAANGGHHGHKASEDVKILIPFLRYLRTTVAMLTLIVMLVKHVPIVWEKIICVQEIQVF